MAGRSTSTWNGRSRRRRRGGTPPWPTTGAGIGGFFERTFAPRGLRRIHGELLDNLTRRLGAEPSP